MCSATSRFPCAAPRASQNTSLPRTVLAMSCASPMRCVSFHQSLSFGLNWWVSSSLQLRAGESGEGAYVVGWRHMFAQRYDCATGKLSPLSDSCLARAVLFVAKSTFLTASRERALSSLAISRVTQPLFIVVYPSVPVLPAHVFLLSCALCQAHTSPCRSHHLHVLLVASCVLT